MQSRRYIAIDLGAESGRIVAGTLEDDKLELDELYRFRTQGTMLQGNLRWNVIRFWEEIQTGLRKYVEKYGSEAAGIGVDTWGVTLIGLNSDDDLAYTPFHYRASIIADPMLDNFKEKFGVDKVFDITGLQFMWFNSSVHLYAMLEKYPELMRTIKTFLLIPDYFNFLLSGKKATEYTIASTSQLLDVRKRVWSKELIGSIGADPVIFPPITMPGQQLGLITDEVKELTGLADVPIHLVASHDTGSAIAAIPHTNPELPWAYLSSGTWSLLGVEIPEPIVNERVKELNLTNEGGIDSTIRLLKNIMGLWLIQECKREWEKDGKSIDYSEIALEAEKAEPFRSLIYPDDARFFAPKSMVSVIKNFCTETGQPVPETVAQIARCIFESLAYRYRQTIEDLQALIGQEIKQLHIVGGGSKNKLLCQMTANATNREVITGPVEATAIGNLLVQAKSGGQIKNLNHLRQVVSNSFPIEVFSANPDECDRWFEKYQFYQNLIK